MSNIRLELRRFVVERAGNRCEYCGLSQEGQEATFHIDHIIPLKAGGNSEDNNLALSCVSCSLHKAARQTAIDPISGQEVQIYNPRKNHWNEHFRWKGIYLTGISPTGRATIELLKMNRKLILAIRQVEVEIGRIPSFD